MLLKTLKDSLIFKLPHEHKSKIPEKQDIYTLNQILLPLCQLNVKGKGMEIRDCLYLIDR